MVLFALTGFLSLEIIFEHSDKQARECLHGQDHVVLPLYLESLAWLIVGTLDLANDKHGDGNGDVEGDEGRWRVFGFCFCSVCLAYVRHSGGGPTCLFSLHPQHDLRGRGAIAVLTPQIRNHWHKDRAPFSSTGQ